MGRWKHCIVVCIIIILSAHGSLFAQQKTYCLQQKILTTKQTKQLIFLAVLALLVHKVTAPEITFPPICYSNESVPLQIIQPVAETLSVMRCHDASIFLPSDCHSAALNVLLIFYITLIATFMATCIGGT